MKAQSMVQQLTFLSSRMLDKSVIILISGKAGSGKTTFASVLKSGLEPEYDTGIKSFASEVKVCATNSFNWDGIKDIKGRKLLQSVGNIGREYDKDLWVRYTLSDIENEIYSKDIYIIDDWRFPNEKDFIEKFNMFYVFTVRVERFIVSTSPDKDVSETSLPAGFTIVSKEDDVTEEVNSYYDLVVNNDGTTKDLEDFVEVIKIYLEKLEDKYG